VVLTQRLGNKDETPPEQEITTIRAHELVLTQAQEAFDIIHKNPSIFPLDAKRTYNCIANRLEKPHAYWGSQANNILELPRFDEPMQACSACP